MFLPEATQSIKAAFLEEELEEFRRLLIPASESEFFGEEARKYLCSLEGVAGKLSDFKVAIEENFPYRNRISDFNHMEHPDIDLIHECIGKHPGLPLGTNEKIWAQQDANPLKKYSDGVLTFRAGKSIFFILEVSGGPKEASATKVKNDYDKIIWCFLFLFQKILKKIGAVTVEDAEGLELWGAQVVGDQCAIIRCFIGCESRFIVQEVARFNFPTSVDNLKAVDLCIKTLGLLRVSHVFIGQYNILAYTHMYYSITLLRALHVLSFFKIEIRRGVMALSNFRPVFPATNWTKKFSAIAVPHLLDKLYVYDEE
ncbi:6235_t:CDS:2 [Paraglomus brasilianum]|uniref:6235_t:CDS:1 n=1 Tax=Paraglomus brasilianum TaxID=144538 RepID=A0A9N9FQX6_9GLOM|nr:6235_t:CDS:2 [Paraglomus brasilianum]